MKSTHHTLAGLGLALSLAGFLFSLTVTLLPIPVAEAQVRPVSSLNREASLLATTPPTFPANALITPTNGVTLTYPWPTFQWQAATDAEGGAISYTLRLTSSGSAVVWEQANPATITTTTSVTTASLPLPNGVYTWTVQATDAQANHSGYLTPTTFVVEAGLVFPANPLISPAAGVTVTTAQPTFDWLDGYHPDGQPLSYTLRLTSSGVVTSVWGQTTTATVIVSQSHYVPLQLLADDHYTWAVEAHDQGGNRSGFVSPAQFSLAKASAQLYYLPSVLKNYSDLSVCPTTSANAYEIIEFVGPPADRPGPLHGDLNLKLRGYAPTNAFLGLLDLSGTTAGNPPQLAGLFNPNQVPAFSSVYQVNNWDWSCGSNGCPGPPITNPAVTMAGLATGPGQPIFIPERGPEIYGGGYKAMVLYAEAQRITLGYTRMDTVANGYAVHIEGICVDANLLALYQAQVDGIGRHQKYLPALRNNQTLGSALGAEIQVVIRDRGSFLDPRSRKDWWQGF